MMMILYVTKFQKQLFQPECVSTKSILLVILLVLGNIPLACCVVNMRRTAEKAILKSNHLMSEGYRIAIYFLNLINLQSMLILQLVN
jgi:hypothetical protein